MIVAARRSSTLLLVLLAAATALQCALGFVPQFVRPNAGGLVAPSRSRGLPSTTPRAARMR